MLEASSGLPDGVAVLQAMIALQSEKLPIFETEIKERDYRIEKLKHEFAGLRRHRFGARSEALDQLELTLEEEEIERAVAPQSDNEDLLLLRSVNPSVNPAASHCLLICTATTRFSPLARNVALVVGR